MRKKLTLLAAAAAITSLTAFGPASSNAELCYELDVQVGGDQVVDESGCLEDPTATQSAGAFCYDVDVNVNGDQLVDESGCQDLPV